MAMEKNELKALRVLEESAENGTTVANIANRTGMTRAGALELLKRLKGAGYVDGHQVTAQQVWRFWITERGEQRLSDEEFGNDLQIELL